jgi:hypothetical protein
VRDFTNISMVRSDRCWCPRSRRWNLRAARNAEVRNLRAALAGQTNEKIKGSCEICKRTNRVVELVNDHVHGTTELRGVLCIRCNFCLGHFKDDPARIREVLYYAKNPWKAEKAKKGSRRFSRSTRTGHLVGGIFTG